ncbi:MAG TPA: nuclear transport factor 2 family protein [Gemmatimonadaceae bacterium]|nr:nuclear transport factor 2 family protein [Gemmatimonadaceae bacterium]
MKRLPFAVAFIVLALFASSTARAQGGSQPDPERAAVQQVIADYATQVQAGNLTALDSVFHGRGVHILTDTATTHGWPEYRDKFLKPELARFKGLQFTHSAIEPQVRGTVAWVAFREELSGETASGPAKISGRGTAVLEKLDGKWRIVHLHISR